MIAIDTNVLVRVLTNDNPAQAKQAAIILEHERIFIPKTVILETEWVLRFCYDLDKEVIVNAIKKIIGLPNVFVEDDSNVLRALELNHDGYDFADALHLSTSGQVTKFLTFDKKFVNKAKNIEQPIVELV